MIPRISPDEWDSYTFEQKYFYQLDCVRCCIDHYFVNMRECQEEIFRCFVTIEKLKQAYVKREWNKNWNKTWTYNSVHGTWQPTT